jgi:hypothetical protein
MTGLVARSVYLHPARLPRWPLFLVDYELPYGLATTMGIPGLHPTWCRPGPRGS